MNEGVFDGQPVYETIVEQIDEAAFVVDDDRCLAYANSRALEIADATLDEIRGVSIETVAADMVSTDADRATLETALTRVLAGETTDPPEVVELQVDVPTGTVLGEYSLSPITEDDVIIGAVVLSRDITDHNEREQRLSEERERFQHLLTVAPDPIFVADVETEEIVETNEAAERVTDLDREELLGKPIQELHPAENSDRYMELFKSLERSPQTFDELPDGSQTYLVTDHNEKIPVEISAAAAELGEQTVAYGIFRDVSKHKEREKRIESERAFLQTVIESLPYPFYVMDIEDYTIELANSQAAVETGDTCYEVTHRRELPCNEGPDPIECPITKVSKTGEPHAVEHIHYNEEEKERIYQVHGSPILDEDGSVTMMAESNIDVTDRLKRERKLEQTRERLQLALDAADAGVWQMDTQTEVVHGDDRVTRLWGYESGEFNGTFDEFADHVHPEDRPELEVAYETAITERSGFELEFRVLPEDGSFRWIQAHATVQTDEGGTPRRLIGISRDITTRKKREQELRQKTKALEAAPVGITMTDPSQPDNPLVDVNGAFTEITGYEKEEVVGRNCRFLQGKNTDPESVAEIREAIDDAEPVDVTLRNYRKDGTEFWNRVSIAPVRGENGDVERFVGFQLDVTERKERERDLEETTQRLNVALEGTNTGVWEWDLGTNEVVWTESTDHLFGIEPGTFEETYDAFAEYVHPDDLLDLETAVERTVSTGDPLQTEYRIQTGDSRQLWGEVRGELIEEDGDVQRLVGIVTDVTERKEREQELKRTRTLVEKTQENASIGWFEVDLGAETLNWSDEVYRIHDLPLGHEVELEEAINFYHPDDRPTIRRAVEELANEGNPYDLELRIITPEDRVRWIRTVGDPQFNDDGDVVGILGIFQDITERKEREQRLRQFREAVEDTAHVVYITDADGTIEYVNPSFEEVTGYTRGEAIGRTPQLLKSGEHTSDYYEELWRTIESGERWEDEVADERADGEQIVLNQTISPITDGDGVPQKFVAVAQDITQRKEYEEALEEAREELRQIIDLVPDLLFAKNRDGEYLLANEATAATYGMTPEELEGMSESEMIPNIGDATEFRKDDIEVLESGEPKEIPKEQITTVDGETHLFQTTKIPYEVPGTNDEAVLGYARDVTELKEYERLLERQRDNLKVLNQVVRHDIRNDLQLVLAYAETLEGYVEEDGEEYVRQVLQAAREAVDITTTARDVTEVLLQQNAERAPVRLRRVLQNEVEGVRSSNEQALVIVEGPIPHVEVLADDMLGSAFRNLLTNAIIHSDAEVPEVTVTATVSGTVARIRVADNGPGIPDDQKERIFEEGEKGLESGGTGLGLYLVRTLIDRYEGDVRVEDNDSTGSVFIVELPLAD